MQHFFRTLNLFLFLHKVNITHDFKITHRIKKLKFQWVGSKFIYQKKWELAFKWCNTNLTTWPIPKRNFKMSVSEWWKMNISKWKLTSTMAKGSWQGQWIRKIAWDSSTFTQVWENVKEVNSKHSLMGNHFGNYVKGW